LYTAVVYAKTAEPIDLRFDCGHGWAEERISSAVFARWCQYAFNTIEQSMCGGDAACCQITLTTCYILRIVRPVFIARQKSE